MKTHTVYFNGTYPGKYTDFTPNKAEAVTMTYQQAVNFVNRVKAAGGTAVVVSLKGGN